MECEALPVLALLATYGEIGVFGRVAPLMLGESMEFLQKGGTKFAHLSTSASQDVAMNFASFLY